MYRIEMERIHLCGGQDAKDHLRYNPNKTEGFCENLPFGLRENLIFLEKNCILWVFSRDLQLNQLIRFCIKRENSVLVPVVHP